MHASKKIAGVLCTLLLAAKAHGETPHAPGVSDTEITIGQTIPYSGPASAYGTVGKAMAAAFAQVNDQGGIDGKKIRLLSLDDGFSPPKAVEQTRRLVEHDDVLLIFGTVGTPTNAATSRYLNARGIPQLFILTGSSKLGDAAALPWTIPMHYSFEQEASIYARYLIEHRPAAKIAVLYQNDDYGKSLLTSFKSTLSRASAAMPVAEASYELSDASIDQQIVSLQASGADTLVDFSTSKATAQAIRKAYDVGWRPLHIVTVPASSIPSTLRAAGLEKSVGLISATFLKDINDPALANDPEVRDYRAWFVRYYPDGDIADERNVQGYVTAQAMIHVLRRCARDLTRECAMQQASGLHDVRIPMLLPGVRLNTSRSDHFPIRQLQLVRFDGTRWVPFGDLIGR